MSVGSFPPASLPIQLAELKRERKMRAGVYPHWIQTGKIKREVADYQTNALDGAIKTLETLMQAMGQPGRREIVEALRAFVRHYPSGINPDLDAAYSAALDMLDKLPA